VKGDGYVYAWGYNRYGQTGVIDDVNLLGADSTVPVPTGLEGLGLGSLEPDREYILTGGRDHSLAVTEDGRCLSWGSIGGNSLGVRQDMMSEDDLLFEDGSETPRILTKPTMVSGVESRVEKASVGWGHSILVSKSGTAYAWGSNGEYEVKQPRSDGLELPSAVQTSPLRGLRVVDAAAGRQFSVLLVE
jgi:regulator of chromosome condensation